LGLRAALIRGQEFATQTVGANRPIESFEIDADSAWSGLRIGNTEQCDAAGMRNIEIRQTLAGELRPSARTALQRYCRGRYSQVPPKNPAQCGAACDKAQAQGCRAETIGPRHFIGGKPMLVAGDLNHPPFEIAPPQCNARVHSGQRRDTDGIPIVADQIRSHLIHD
jgi:hypothetical protein